VKKEELKKLLKPMIKECIKECLYEEGILSSVVSEVVKGMGTGLIQEQVKDDTPAPTFKMKKPTPAANTMNESRKKLLDAIGRDAYGGVDIFEGTTPAPADRSPEMGSPLGNMEPSDPGVDISGIVALGSKKWKAFMR